MDKEESRTVYVGYVPGRSGSVILWPFDQELTQQMFELERKYVHFKLEICSVGNINMYGEYLPVVAEAATLDEFEKLIVEQFGPKRKKTISEQVKRNVDQYIKLKNGEPNNVKVIRMEFLEFVEEVADKNSGAFETLAAMSEAEKGDLPRYETVDELFVDLDTDDIPPD